MITLKVYKRKHKLKGFHSQNQNVGKTSQDTTVRTTTR